jgi:hypothetical protein
MLRSDGRNGVARTGRIGRPERVQVDFGVVIAALLASRSPASANARVSG